MSILKTLPKRIPTNEEGIFYKSIINENNKEIDKIYLIRYRENDNDKLKTIGKYSQGIRINYCKQIRNEIITKLRLGETPPIIAQKKQKEIVKLDYFADIYFKEKEFEVKDIEKLRKSYNPRPLNVVRAIFWCLTSSLKEKIYGKNQIKA
jgi:hypothetical protein